ncbi:NUDIX domain-containing protein [Paenibacillus albiflavus]|uniref:NUDIX domain-containing protein n=1 Tax=Paenibacillus albiflavus TaxID=2545760 RepID=A0A4R4EJ52_9BACL|nr:NUDIX domain-containing protein [Paenibacillus albiflavus]TCZ79270.1 NUDIX domain-containing protein [Paenibacillus albiflavus]
MKTRLMSTAFLSNRTNMLMLKRNADRKLAPGLWTGVGGHIEPEEMNDPERACIREILEETGISSDELIDLTFKYQLIRIKETEIRVQYVYFGKTLKNHLITNDEGELHWIDIESLLSLELPWTIRAMLTHYLTTGMNTNDPYVGVLTINPEGSPVMEWSSLKDPIVV